MSDDTSFHRLLAKARPSTISQPLAAAAVGVSRGTLSLWERGYGSPTVKQVVILWDFYGTPGEVRAAMLTAAALPTVPE